MANEIIKNVTPDYVTHESWTSKRETYKFELPVELGDTQIFIVSDFEDREGEVNSVSSTSLVKVDASGNVTAIAIGDNLNGYRIGYQSTGTSAIGTSIDEALVYYSAI